MRTIHPTARISFYTKLILGLSLLFVGITNVKAQTNVWTDISASDLTNRTSGVTTPVQFRALALNKGALTNFFTSVPKETVVAVRQSASILSIPMPDGSTQNFRIVESPIMEQALADKFPDIKTFSGQGIENPAATIRLDWTMYGLHAIIPTAGAFVFIEPFNRLKPNQYIVYYQKDLPAPLDLRLCEVKEALSNKGQAPILTELASGTQLRTYRMAMSATGEYTALNGGTVASALAALTTVVNQVDAIYEVEVAIRFVLIGNNNLIIYTNAGTDPFSNTAGNPCSTPIRAENQASIDLAIGLANYDIGHVFTGTNIGGCAAGAVICGASKAWGASGVRLGSAFDVGLTAHEMGHQFSAGHTFNSNIGSCFGGQYSPTTAYEPASGTTIMSYAGSCHDIQGFRDMQFHTISYQEIVTFSTAGGGNACPVVSNTGNAAPTVNAGASGFSIPISTPFILNGSGNDPDGDALTFSWEEFDLGPQGNPLTPAGTAPIFRSFPPVTGSSRTFPQISDILNNTSTLGEILPSYGRAMNFRLTARDNRANGGGVEYSSMSFNVDGASGPFRVTSPNTNVSWCPGPQTVTWDVANTTAAPVSVANVNIRLSTDGGNTFPTLLLGNTPNDGSQSVIIPCVFSTTARIKVEAVGNIFFDLSNANFRTGDNTDPTFTDPPDVVIYKDEDCNYNANTEMTGDVTDEDDNCDNTLNATFVDAVGAGSCEGETVITRTWTLTDDCNNSTVKVQMITITDTTSPTFTQPADITIYKDENCEHDASVGATGDVTDEADNCDPTLDATFSDVSVPGSCMGEEIITRTWTLTDDCGNSAQLLQVITVEDTTRPAFTNVSPDPAILWPPNHQMVNVTINYDVADNCSDADHITSVLTVVSNEPVNGPGDGNTEPDWEVLDNHHVLLRAERSGKGDGRVYTITITSTDDCGNVATTSLIVTVAHDESGRLITTVLPVAGDLVMKVTPNPSLSDFNLFVNSNIQTEKIKIMIFDISGRKVEEHNLGAETSIRIGGSYQPGVYIVRATQGDRSRELKLIKAK